MINQLNPQFETMFLLSNCPWEEEQKELAIAEMEKFGLAGQDFYHRHFLPIEQYYRVFTKHMIQSPGTKLLHEMDEIVLIICANAFVDHPEWLSDLQSVSEKTVHDYIEKNIYSEAEAAKEGDLFSDLEAQALSDKTKWQLVIFLQKAKQYLSAVAEAVAINLPAYQKAAAKVEPELNLLLEKFSDSMQKSNKTNLLRLPGQIDPDAVIIPTLALPMAVLIVNGTCFYGLLSERISAGDETSLTKEELMIGAKALSEKSKVEILLSLKADSRFNLEIAELVGLTPATVSHHMNTLLAAGFVEVEKRDGKVFYKLARDGVKRYLTDTGRLLLPTENN